jgi:hypothetical protein
MPRKMGGSEKRLMKRLRKRASHPQGGLCFFCATPGEWAALKRIGQKGWPCGKCRQSRLLREVSTFHEHEIEQWLRRHVWPHYTSPYIHPGLTPKPSTA